MLTLLARFRGSRATAPRWIESLDAAAGVDDDAVSIAGLDDGCCSFRSLAQVFLELDTAGDSSTP